MTGTATGGPVQRRTPPKVPRPVPVEVVASPAVDRLVAELAAVPRGVARASAQVLERFWDQEARTTPLVEPGPDGSRTVTFLLRDDDAQEVLLFVNRVTDERRLDASLMRRVPGTDVWHVSYRMPATWRASYSFVRRARGAAAPWQVDDQVAVRGALDHGVADPRNPDGCRNRAGVRQSVVALDEAPPQPWLEPRDGVPRGSLETAVGPGGRSVQVYRSAPGPSPEPGTSAAPRPVLVVLDGEVWTGVQDLPTTLDNLVAHGLVRPLVAVLVDSGGRERRWAELGAAGREGRTRADGTRADRAQADGASAGSVLSEYVGTELLAWLRARDPRVSARREDVVVVGQSLGALTALWCLATHPETVGAVLSQSASLWQEEIFDALADADLVGTRAWVEVGSQEWVLAPYQPRLVQALAARGSDVTARQYDGGHDYACWRGGVADGLQALLGVR